MGSPRFWGGIPKENTPESAPLCLGENHAARERIDCVFDSGRRTSTSEARAIYRYRARQLSCGKITFGGDGSSGRLETGFRKGLYDTCSQACSSLLTWNTRMGFFSPLRRVFLALRSV